MRKHWERAGLTYYRKARGVNIPRDAAFMTASWLLTEAQALEQARLTVASVRTRQHAEHWFALADLAAARMNLDTLPGRFWTLGRLSEAGEVVIWAEDGTGYVLAVAVCRNLGCALKHARAHLFSGKYTAVALYGTKDQPLTGFRQSYLELAADVAQRV